MMLKVGKILACFLWVCWASACTSSPVSPSPVNSLQPPLETTSLATPIPSPQPTITPSPSPAPLSTWANPTLASPLQPTQPASAVASAIASTAAAADRGVQGAIADLAARLGISPSTVQVLRVSGADFPSGDLGCPASGTPALPQPAFVTGKEALLQAGSRQFIYHIHGGQAAFCGEIRPVP